MARSGPPRLRSVVPSVVADLRSSSLAGDYALSHLRGDLRPVGATDDEGEADVEDDASDAESEPEAADAHLALERKVDGQRHPDDVVADKGVDGAPDLETQASDNAGLHSMDCVEPDIYQ